MENRPVFSRGYSGRVQRKDVKDQMGKNARQTGRKDSRKKDTVIAVVFLAAVVIGLLAAMLYGSGALDFLTGSGGDRKVDMATGKVVKKEIPYDASEHPDSGQISVPGYEKLTFQAGQKTQSVYLTNPEDNTCYFVMSLVLSDGTVIWKSGKLEPGLAFDRIGLDQTLDAGTYEDVTLNYDCYSMTDDSRLNGSSMKLQLEVT